MMEPIYLFVGGAVVWGLGGLWVIGLAVLVVGLTLRLGLYLGGGAAMEAKERDAMSQWVRSGRPKWRKCRDGVFRMLPTDGPYESDEKDRRKAG